MAFRFTWKKNGLVVVAEKEDRISVNKSDGTLEIIQPTIGDQGIYWCNAISHYGRATMPEVDVTSAGRFRCANIHDRWIIQRLVVFGTCTLKISSGEAGIREYYNKVMIS